MLNADHALRPLADKVAVGLSGLCAIHCLALPFAIALSPAIASLAISDESFHLWMVAAVIPISFFAIGTGFRVHKRASVVLICVVGLVFITGAALAGHEYLGENGERALTLFGALMIAVSHFLNYRYSPRAAHPEHGSK
ncbi:MAG: MerC domain-containing protein [Pseudomonadota bacterium]